MGGSNSKTVAESFNDVVTEVVARNITSCAGYASQDQIWSIRQIKGNVVIRDTSMVQIAVVNMDCMQNTLNDVDVQNQIDVKTDSTLHTIDERLLLSLNTRIL